MQNQMQELNFQQVGDLVMRNILQPVAPYFKGMPNAIGFYKRYFLHVISARIIVL